MGCCCGLKYCAGGVLWCVVCELPTASYLSGACCGVAIDWDPSVRCSHPGKMTRTPERQLLRARLVLACVNLVLFVSHVSLVSRTSHSYRTSHLYRMSHSRHSSLSVRFRESASSYASSVDNSSCDQVALVLNEELVDTDRDMLVDLALPTLHVVGRFLVCHIKDYDDDLVG